MSLKYEEINPIPHSLSSYALLVAIAKCYGSEVPTLNLPRSALAWIWGTDIGIPVQLNIDPELQDTEWYVEFNGNRFGSRGA